MYLQYILLAPVDCAHLDAAARHFRHPVYPLPKFIFLMQNPSFLMNNSSFSLMKNGIPQGTQHRYSVQTTSNLRKRPEQRTPKAVKQQIASSTPSQICTNTVHQVYSLGLPSRDPVRPPVRSHLSNPSFLVQIHHLKSKIHHSKCKINHFSRI